ncbi:MAG TPA: ISKra4 family transposase [Streptosporangiaceae bacterium]|nr:ISKra4 family transposase [Streptosporangiaceae bacterium]
MEQYVLEELAASAERAVAGLGPLACMLAGLAGGLCGPGAAGMTLDGMERLVAEAGRELLRGILQLGLDGQAAAEVRLAEVTGADGVPRRRAERDHARTVVTVLGRVRVARIAYRAGVAGVPALFPRDAVLNLPPRRYSWYLQYLAVRFVQAGAYEQAQDLLLAATGVKIGKLQLEQITAEGAADVPGFYPAPGGPDGAADRPGQQMPLVLSADGKGVAMRPESRRRRTKAPGKRVRTFQKRRGTGEKGHKRMAETGCVYDARPAPRTPEQIMNPGQDTAARRDGPRQAVNRRYFIDIAADRAHTISTIFDEAQRRDPVTARTWIALIDGDNHQISLFRAQAADRGVTVTILIDFIHVLEYLWKAAWCFHAPRDPAIEDWVRAQALDILHGRVPDVITRITQLARDHPPQGSEHANIIRKTLHYLDAKQPYLDYPRALAAGWPIATGVIEGACRHLVNDRMGITGARWNTSGAQAVLWLRAIRANGDTGAYWTHHVQHELQRNHHSRYQASHTLAA